MTPTGEISATTCTQYEEALCNQKVEKSLYLLD
jgi:hypothetical protein